MIEQALRRLTVSAIALGALGSLAQSSLYTVEPGHRAVIFDRFQGVKDVVIGEGMHFRIPWVQRPIPFDVRTRPRPINTTTGTKDLQNISITLRVLHRPEVERLPAIFQNLGLDYDERVLPSIGNEVMKAVVAQYNAEELITRREQVSRQIRSGLEQRAREFHLILDDISITHLAFGKEFTDAVERKQVAEQEAERSKFVVLRTEQEKLASIIRAEGDAQAARLISEAMKAGPGLVEVRRIEAAREIAATLAKSRNVAYLPSGGNVLFSMGAAA